MKTIIITLITILTLMTFSDTSTNANSQSSGIYQDGTWVLSTMNGKRPIEKTSISLRIRKDGITKATHSFQRK